VVEGDDRIGALLLLDRLEQLDEPHELLTDLSAWALDHGDPVLVVSVPNVAHFDVGLRLLCGDWAPGQPEPAGGTPVHFFTESALERLVERCGWRVVAREDFDRANSEGRDVELEDSIPEEMVGALRVLSQTYNPQSTVEQFVWALTPVKIEARPTSFAAAIEPPAPIDEREFPPEQRHPVYDYMASMGIVASEINRRAVAIRRKPRPRWKRAILDRVNATPRTADAYKQLRRWFG
jgi:hypothetical protein